LAFALVVGRANAIELMWRPLLVGWNINAI
jgi:hypothetical protein